MSKNLYDLRFGIKRGDGFVSNIWRLWITASGDVYLATRRMGGIEKFSFHMSGICRSAFTKEYGTPPSMQDRAIFKWVRTKTPPLGSGGASKIVWIAFPTDFLSRNNEPIETKVDWIHVTEPGGATYIEMGYTFETEQTIRSAYSENSKLLHSYTSLPSGEAFYVSSYQSDWENNNLRSPPAQGSIFPELIFSADDPNNTGRPIRISFGPKPKDGDALVIQELGGYKASSS